jgi:heme exporter protein D
VNWSSWSEFFAMGGYGIYVWGSYIVTFICVISELLLISRRHRTLIETYGLIHESYAEENSDNEASLTMERLSVSKENQNVEAVSGTEEIKK